jgi:hypothetical protein
VKTISLRLAPKSAATYDLPISTASDASLRAFVYCGPLWGFATAKQPELQFRALLTEGGTQWVEFARA